MKWNPATGRFEGQAGQDFPPAGTQAGQQYRDTVSGQMKIRSNAEGMADQLVQGSTTSTTLVKPKGSKTPSALETMQQGAAAYANSVGTPTTTTPKGTTTTGAPKGTTTTTAPAGSTTSTTVPKGGKTNISGGGMGGPTAGQVSSGQFVGSPAEVASEDAALKTAIDEAFKGGDMAAVTALVTLMSKGSSSGSGSSTPSKESLAASYNAAITAANMTQKAGKTAQDSLNLQGQNLYNTQLAAIQKYYSGQQETATKLIDKAGADFTASMPEATAYATAQVANLPQAQQGLTGALEAYGATGQQAQGVSDQNKAYLDALAKMQTSSNAQLSQADKTYMNNLRTAAEGNRTQAKQTLTGNLASLQAQDTSAADATRQGLITKGIETMQSATDTAAAAKAKAAADYGVPKKKPKPKTPKK
jgi:hypothetical protein